jgi:iron(II)-dependent oxidoreductase
MVRIGPAKALIGRDDVSDPEQTPAHFVVLSAYLINKNVVTSEEYARAVKAGRVTPPPDWSSPDPERAQWPVTGVNWAEAGRYCEAFGNRLPTEAEWEYAARGAEARIYPWGNQFKPELANTLESGPGHPEPVGQRANGTPEGVLDMAGNVWQWTHDDYRPYENRPARFVIPAGAKVIRGGSFQSDQHHATSAARNYELAGERTSAIGFRCARSL